MRRTRSPQPATLLATASCAIAPRWRTCRRSQVQCSLNLMVIRRWQWWATGPVLAMAVACSLLAGCGKNEKEETPVVSGQAAAAQKADISRVISTEAVVFPILQSAITPKINAPVKRFLVNRGQKVHKGQLLAELENRDLSAAAMDTH